MCGELLGGSGGPHLELLAEYFDKPPFRRFLGYSQFFFFFFFIIRGR